MIDKVSLPIWISGIWFTSSALVYGSYRIAQKKVKKSIEAKGYHFIKDIEPDLKGKLVLFTIASLPTLGYVLMRCTLEEQVFENFVLKNGLKKKQIVKKQEIKIS